MTILVGYDKVISKKNNKKYTNYHTIDSENREQINEDGTCRKGQTVEAIFVCDDDVEVVGTPVLGGEIRLLKEKNEYGFDAVSMIICKDKPVNKASK